MKFVAVIFAIAGMLNAQNKPSQPAAAEKVSQAEVRPAVVPPQPSGANVVSTAKSETLRFNVNWPSGLSLGEGEWTSSQTPEGWQFSFHVDAGIPGFVINESAQSKATVDLCSVELTKEGTRGPRKVGEKTTFDSSALMATRTTLNGGGKTEIRMNACARDALTFIQFVRRELAAGRVPASQPVYYGAAYQSRVQYTGTQMITSGNTQMEADKLTATIKGPATELTVDLFFARDPARTPLLVQIPVAIGKFSVEFVR